MAGYTRQEAANIVDAATIEASHFNNEYNALEAAFNASTGHAHDGSSGEGPKLALAAAVSGQLPVANGGTAGSTAAAARTNLGLVIGTDVQAYDAGLADIAGLAVTDGNFIVGNGTNWVVESGATARTSLGVPSTTEAALVVNNLSDLASASTSRTNLGVAIGSDVQAYDAGLADLAGLAVTDGNFIVGNGTNWVAESGATARTSLGAVGASDSVSWTGAHDITVTSGTAFVASGSNGTNLFAVDSTADNVTHLNLDLNTYTNPVVKVIGGNYAGTTWPHTGGLIKAIWDKTSPVAGDTFNFITFGTTSHNHANIQYQVLDFTTSSEDGEWIIQSSIAGALTEVLKIGDGVEVGSPTGGYKGAGTINAEGVYDDNTLLTDYVADFYNGDLDEIQLQFYDTLWTGSEENPARTFLRDRVESFDIDYMANTLLETGSLPAMPTREQWVKEGRSVGQLINGLWETLEVAILQIKELKDGVQ